MVLHEGIINMGKRFGARRRKCLSTTLGCICFVFCANVYIIGEILKAYAYNPLFVNGVLQETMTKTNTE